jgi:hypothetical protein
MSEIGDSSRFSLVQVAMMFKFVIPRSVGGGGNNQAQGSVGLGSTYDWLVCAPLLPKWKNVWKAGVCEIKCTLSKCTNLTRGDPKSDPRRTIGPFPPHV